MSQGMLHYSSKRVSHASMTQFPPWIPVSDGYEAISASCCKRNHAITCSECSLPDACLSHSFPFLNTHNRTNISWNAALIS